MMQPLLTAASYFYLAAFPSGENFASFFFPLSVYSISYSLFPPFDSTRYPVWIAAAGNAFVKASFTALGSADNANGIE